MSETGSNERKKKADFGPDNAIPGTGTVLEIRIADSVDTCFGVRGAIKLARRLRLPILGPLVHNPHILNELEKDGIRVLERFKSPEELVAEGIREVIITAHGYPRQEKEKLSRAGITVHDATCPVLGERVYRIVKEAAAAGRRVFLAGDPGHAEIIAVRSYGEDVTVLSNRAEAEDAVLKAAADEDIRKKTGTGRPLLLCQTTITADLFGEIAESLKKRLGNALEVIDTRCKPVREQQAAVEKLALWADRMLVIGGINSANTAGLARIAAKILGPEKVRHMDSVHSIDMDWLRGTRRLGIGAGTSTPLKQVEEVAAWISERWQGHVRVSNLPVRPE